MENTYTCGADYQDNIINKSTFRGRLYWEGKDLVLQRYIFVQVVFTIVLHIDNCACCASGCMNLGSTS